MPEVYLFAEEPLHFSGSTYKFLLGGGALLPSGKVLFGLADLGAVQVSDLNRNPVNWGFIVRGKPCLC
jgi:hypothetical protein